MQMLSLDLSLIFQSPRMCTKSMGEYANYEALYYSYGKENEVGRIWGNDGKYDGNVGIER